MDITMQCGAFVDALGQIVTIATRKTSIPVLTGVLVEADGAGVTLSATDMEISARVACQAQVAQPGLALLPAKRLYDVAKLLPADQAIRIAATADGPGVRVECGRYGSRLQVLAAADFPAFPAATDAPRADLVGSTLAALVRKVRYAVAEGDQRYFLAGAFLSLAGPRMTVVATDGHRLAIASAARPDGFADAQALISSKALAELTDLFEHVDGTVTFARDGNHLRFEADGRLLLATIVDGQFPAYERIIPKGNDKSALVERDDLIAAIRRVALASSDATRSLLIDLAPDGVTVSASSLEIGDAREPVEATTLGGPMSVRLSAPYLLDFLDATEPGKVMLELRDGASAVLLRQVDESASTYRCVVMPIVL